MVTVLIIVLGSTGDLVASYAARVCLQPAKCWYSPTIMGRNRRSDAEGFMSVRMCQSWCRLQNY